MNTLIKAIALSISTALVAAPAMAAPQEHQPNKAPAPHVEKTPNKAPNKAQHKAPPKPAPQHTQ